MSQNMVILTRLSTDPDVSGDQDTFGEGLCEHCTPFGIIKCTLHSSALILCVDLKLVQGWGRNSHIHHVVHVFCMSMCKTDQPGL